jgi:RHS repeat-associated protein
LADYFYLGRDNLVEESRVESARKRSPIGLGGGNDPDTGDIYRGLDRFGRVKDLLWYTTSTLATLERVQHGYDRAGNRVWPGELADVLRQHDELYGYDGLERLKSLDRGTLNSTESGLVARTFGQCWTLDSTGNWAGFQQDSTGSGSWDLIQNRSANSVNEITSLLNSAGSPWAAPGYDAVGNMTGVPKPTALGGSYAASYDAWNRLVQLVDGANTVAVYQYDGAQRRTVQQRYTAGALSETRHLYHSVGWQVLEERVGSAPTAERQFVWGLRYLDELVLRDRDSTGGGTLNERLYALQDPNWNAVALSDTTGVVQERYGYDGYGMPAVLTAAFGPRGSSLYDWEVRFAGYRWDRESGLHLVRKRVYNQILGVWLARDPLGHADGENLYQYDKSGPIGATDPSGTKTVFRTMVVKRLNIDWGVVFKLKPEDEDEDAWGHWWIEIGPKESYGWWPKNPVPSAKAAIKGVPGELNGVTSYDGTPTKDSKHRKPATHSENPFLTRSLLRTIHYGPNKGKRCCRLIGIYKKNLKNLENAVKQCVRAAAKDFATKHKTWRYPGRWNCHTFQRWLLDQCCLSISTFWRIYPKKERRKRFPDQ